MPDADALRAQLAVAELEEELASLKDGGDPEQLRAVKDELRFARWVQRGGPAQEAARLEAHEREVEERKRLAAERPDLAGALPPLGSPHSNRAVADLYERWLSERG